MKNKGLFLGAVLLCQSVVAAPVVYNGVGAGTAGENGSGLSLAQQVQILQQSLDNMKSLDFSGKILQLQRQVQIQRGTIDVLTHKIDALQKQQSLQYQDLAQQIEQKTPAQSAVDEPPSKSQPAPVPSAPVSPAEQDKRTYQSAYGLITSHQYPEAIEAFQGYLSIYQNEGRYSSNANYWLGELYSQQHHYDEAKTVLTAVVDDFPQSNKVPDALYKLGVIAMAQNMPDAAQTYFDQLIAQYPNTGSARLAKQKMKDLSAE